MPDNFVRPSWIEIDLDAIAHNISQLREMVGSAVKIFVCLKSNGLGCGANAVARRVESEGGDGLAFGSVDAAIACRQSNVSLPILVYPSALPESAPAFESHQLMPTLSTLDDVDAWSNFVGSQLDVFLKIDTGGCRAGCFPGDAVNIGRAIQASDKLNLAGVYGHPMASYGLGSDTSKQINIFLKTISLLEDAGMNIPIRMLSSSEIILNHPEADLNAIDPGRLIAGVHFDSISSRKRHWQSALVGVKSRIVMKKIINNPGDLPATRFSDQQGDRVLGLIPFGWNDGFPPVISGDCFALVNGYRAPFVGPIHSELIRVDLTDVPDVNVGDEVVLLGKSKGENIGLNDLSDQWGVSEFDIYARLGKSLPKVYV